MSKFHGAKAGYEAGRQFLKKVFGKKSKVSPDITFIKPTFPKNKIQAAVRDVKKIARSAKGQMKRKSQDFDAEINKVKSKLGQSMQKLVGEPVTKSGVSKGKDMKKFKTGKQLAKEKKEDDAIAKEFGVRFKKAGGGMMGRRMGYSEGSNGKIKFDAKKSDLDKSGDLSKYEKARGMAIAKAMAKRKNKKKAI